MAKSEKGSSMSPISKDELSLKIFITRENTIWYVDKDGQPTKYIKHSFEPNETVVAGTLADFITTPLFLKAKYIRVIGSTSNSKFIVQQYSRKVDRGISSIEVCSPMVCSTDAERSDPEIALLAMRSWKWPRSLGGWHEVREADYTSFLLAHEVIKNNNVVNDEVRRALKMHVAWKALSFIPHLDYDYCANLLSILIDPRWYIDFNEPNSGAKIKAYLGLSPKTQEHVSGENSIVGIHSDRCRFVMDTWKTSINPPKNINAIGNFLWRAWLSHDKTSVADLRTSQLFISFLRHTWTAALYEEKHYRESLFIPEYFFKHKEEALAYKRHLANYKEDV